MNTRSTVTYTRPRYARLARLNEDRLIRLIDAGEDLAMYYGPPALPAPRSRQRLQWRGRVTVIGDGGFRTVFTAPSEEFNQYLGASNAEVLTGVDGEIVIRLRDAVSRRTHARHGGTVSSNRVKRRFDAIFDTVGRWPVAIDTRKARRKTQGAPA